MAMMMIKKKSCIPTTIIYTSNYDFTYTYKASRLNRLKLLTWKKEIYRYIYNATWCWWLIKNYKIYITRQGLHSCWNDLNTGGQAGMQVKNLFELPSEAKKCACFFINIMHTSLNCIIVKSLNFEEEVLSQKVSTTHNACFSEIIESCVILNSFAF